jgi:hypothetical protein
VLLGEQLGGRHQRRLVAAVEHQAHRERGHRRLAAADIALDQPRHRVRSREVVRDLLNHPPLSGGELEREHHPRQLIDRRFCPTARRRVPLPQQPVLGHAARERQQLLEGEPEVRRRVATAQRRHQLGPLELIGGRLRVVEAANGGRELRQTELVAQLGGDRVRALIERRQRLLDQSAEPPAPERPEARVDRHDPLGAAVLDVVDLRVDELERAMATTAQRAVQGDREVALQPAIDPRLVEPHHGQGAGVIVDHPADDPQPPPARVAGRADGHSTPHQDPCTLLQLSAQHHPLAPVLISHRQVKHQVDDPQHALLAERRAEPGTDALQRVDRVERAWLETGCSHDRTRLTGRRPEKPGHGLRPCRRSRSDTGWSRTSRCRPV